MIVLDTSALIAILLGEDAADACIEAIEKADRTLISGGTLAEVLIVAARRGVGPQMQKLLEKIDPEVAVVDQVAALGERACIRPGSTSATALPTSLPKDMVADFSTSGATLRRRTPQQPSEFWPNLADLTCRLRL